MCFCGMTKSSPGAGGKRDLMKSELITDGRIGAVRQQDSERNPEIISGIARRGGRFLCRWDGNKIFWLGAFFFSCMNCCLLTKLHASRTKDDCVCVCECECVVKEKRGQMCMPFAKEAFAAL